MPTMSTIMETTLSDAALDQLFREARTANTFTDEPVTEEQIRDIYSLMKWGPTAANSLPLRIVFVTSDEGKARLLPLMAGGNRDKTGDAPAVAILGADADFNAHLPETFPHEPDAKDWFGDAEDRRRPAELNASLQIGYFILAARSIGLSVGPMNGFDAEGVDAEFFAGTRIKSLVVANLGKPGPDAWQERLPRLDFDQAASIV